MMNRFFGYVILLILTGLAGCNSTFENCAEARAYLQNDKNNLEIFKDYSSGLKFQSVCGIWPEINGTPEGCEISPESLHSGLLRVRIKLISTDGIDLIEKLAAGNFQEFDRITQELSFRFKDQVTVLCGEVNLTILDVFYENSFEMSSNKNLLIYAQFPENLKLGDEDLTVIWEDQLFGTGQNTYNFDNSAIKRFINKTVN